MEQYGNTGRWSVVIAITLLGVFLSTTAQTAVFTVNTGIDFGPDANPGDGVCEWKPGNGVCTFRAAIQETNALAGDDTIILPPDRYQLTTAVGGDYSIAGNLTITGSGASTILTGSLKGGVVFVINAGFAVNLSGVTVSTTNFASYGIANSGTLRLSDSTMGVNTAGGGIYNSGTLTLVNSTVSKNSTGARGGGIYNIGTATLINSTVSGNSVQGSSAKAGGGIYNSGALTLVNSTVSSNSAPNGGGIYNSGTLTLVNSTVSGNSAAQGGGIYNEDGITNLFNVTITNNQADDKSGGQGVGGGIFNSNKGTFNFQNTILAGNFETLDFVLTPGECDGTINSIGSNLMTMADCTVSGSAPIIGNPNLGSLKNNGGPTQTHALLAGSPAIDAGNTGGCRDEFGVPLTTDQRGFNRPSLGCDIGAFELRQSTGVVAAVLPSSRSVQVNTPAAAFATVINTGQAIATGCSIAPFTSLPASFVYQTTDPATNQLTGFPNTPANIAPGAAQSFVFAIVPTSYITPIDVQFSFDCTDTDPAPISVGLNTLLLSASNEPVPDIVALAVTLSNDGIVNIPGPNGAAAFAVATVNVGAIGNVGNITVSADAGNVTLPVTISLCETNPATGQCISTIGPTVTTQINLVCGLGGCSNATPSFGIFVQATGNVPFDPAANRIFVRFKDGGAVTRGSTSVAVRTQ